MTKCFKCGGTEIVTGTIKSSRDSVLLDAYFLPDNLRFLAANFGKGVAMLQKKSWACLKCGMVWSETDPDALVDYIRTYGKPSEGSDSPRNSDSESLE